MYQAHWGLRRESPFRNWLDPQSFYQSPTHEEALARLHFLVEEHRRLGLLLGPSGSGKSLLAEVFAERSRRRGWSVARLSLLDVEPTEMLWLLASEWGLNPESWYSAGTLWRTLTDRLAEHRYQKIPTVILLDDADQADRAVLQHVTRLARYSPSPDTWLTLVLIGRPETVSRLREPLLGLVELRIEVEAWQPAETEQFVNTRLQEAGRQTPVFTAPALERLHEVARGIPRRVSQVADLSLLAGAGQNLSQIDERVVEEAFAELGVGG